MKHWLLRFFGLFPFFDKDEYDRQVSAEVESKRVTEEIKQQNFMERQLLSRKGR